MSVLKRYNKKLLIIIFSLNFVFPMFALDLPTRRIVDDSSLRISMRNTWFAETPNQVLKMSPFVHTLPGGGRVQVRSEVAQDEFVIILARERNGLFPGWAQGSWLLTRKKNDGSISRIRVFLRSDPNMYVQFRPSTASDRSMMDVVIYDAYIVRSLSIPYSMNRLLVTPVEEVLSFVETKFPRAYFDPDPRIYQDVRSFISLVRKRLPEVNYNDDGAIDHNGQYVYINTLTNQMGEFGLNCSGFAKWIVDGILRPLTGTRLAVPPLTEPFGDRGSSLTNAFERLRDPFFGLDWTRNLASVARETIYSSPAMGKLEELEVRRQPFASIIQRTKDGTLIRSYPDFLLNAGYSFEGIQPLLYTLAIDEPGHIYLASISNDRGPSPYMRQHFHVAVLIPYFNEYGNFQVTVFESAEETSFSRFRTRYPGHFINLVRIRVDPSFDP